MELSPYYNNITRLYCIQGGTKMSIEQTLKEAEKIAGLKRHLNSVKKYNRRDWSMSGSARLIDLQLKPVEEASAYIVEIHEWVASGHSGIEYAVKIGAFRKGKNANSGKIVYRDMFDAHKDDWSRAYEKIKKFKVERDRVIVRVASNEVERDFEFNI